MFSTIISIILIAIVSYEVFSRNLAVAIVVAAFLFVDYQSWVRGGKSVLFGDKTQIEKDLREIQKLEIKKKLEDLKK